MQASEWNNLLWPTNYWLYYIVISKSKSVPHCAFCIPVLLIQPLHPSLLPLPQSSLLSPSSWWASSKVIEMKEKQKKWVEKKDSDIASYTLTKK